MAVIDLGGVKVGEDNPAYVIAEVGSNHQGDVNVAKDMFALAKYAGANAVKLQKRNNKALFTRAFYNSPYNSENAYGNTYGEHREALEFGEEEYAELKECADELGITLFATPFDIPSVDFLEDLGVPFYKIASACIHNTKLIRYIADKGKPILMSAGGASMDDVDRAVMAASGVPVVLMHCVSMYPTPVGKMNLPRIQRFGEEYPGLVIGLSDHQDGINLGVAAYVLGARVFEKHFTHDHSAKGTDHPFSLEFFGLMQYVKSLRAVQKAMTPLEQPLEEERSAVRKMGQAVYLRRPMKKGNIINEGNLVLKSPMDGIPAWQIDRLVGKVLLEDVEAEQPLDWSYFSDFSVE